MSDRRRGGSGPGTPLRRAVGACGAVTTFLAFGFCSPAAHADFDDLLEPIITAAAAGLDQAGTAFSAFSPDDLVAGATDFGSFADPFGQIDKLVQNVSTQLDDQLRGLGADWPANLLTGALGEPDGHSLAELPGSAAATDSTGTGGFLFGDGGHSGTADATGTAAGGTTPESTGNSGGEGDPTSGTSTGGGHTDSATGTNSDNSSSLPKMSMPSMPSSGGGGNGGGGNGGGGNGSPAKTRASTSPTGTVAQPPPG